jgi:hypothetical protein
MRQNEGYRVATSPNDWVTVKTAEDAVKLGKAFATLVADLGVYKAERERLAAKNERLRRAGDRMAFHAKEEGTGWELHDAADAWLAAKEVQS